MSKITDAVSEMVVPFVSQRGLQLWDVRYEKEGPDRFLRIFLDGERAVELDDCEFISRSIDPLLDERDLIADAYYLEVSSAGLGRRLTRQEHFELMKGREVTVALYSAEDGAKEHTGILIGKEAEDIVIESPPQRRFSAGKVRYVKLNDDLNLF